MNENLPWSLDFFREFDHELTIHEENLTEEDKEEIASMESRPGHFLTNIYDNKGIPWSVEMLDALKDKVSWFMVNQNWPLDKSPEMLDRYKEYIDWSFPFWQWEPEWTPSMIKRFAHRIDFGAKVFDFYRFAKNDPEIRSLLMKNAPEKYMELMVARERPHDPDDATRKKWMYEYDLRNGNIDPTPEDIQYVLENFEPYWLARTEILDWTPSLLDYLSDRSDWHELCNAPDLPFTEELIEKYIDRVEFGRLTEENEVVPGLSSNTRLPWSIRFIEKYRSKWYWSQFPFNPAIPWSDELIDAFIEEWDWITMGWIPGFWNLDRIERYKDHIDWMNFSVNVDTTFSPTLLERFEDRWDYTLLSQNEQLLEQVAFPLFSKINIADFLQEK
jgi:hypothetical protein